MSTAARRGALAALDSARPAIARLDPTRDAEDLAADLIDGWSAVETALRSLVGGSTLSGQTLIRDARARQLIGFEQANALAEFHASAERAQQTDYEPSESDIDAARNGFLKLESFLMAGEQTAEAIGRSASAADAPAGAAPTTPVPAAKGSRWSAWRKLPVWALALVALIVVAGIGTATWYLVAGGGGTSEAYRRGVEYYQRGQREAAVGEFNRAIRENPSDPMPHVYLSRMAREVGNYSLALQEANLAVQADPQRMEALREMGSYLLTVGNYDLARRFYIRAVTADTTDRASMGWLGCTLIRLGRTNEGMTWMNRAGQGAWSGCAMAAAQPVPGGAMPPGQPTSPQGYPPRP